MASSKSDAAALGPQLERDGSLAALEAIVAKLVPAWAPQSGLDAIPKRTAPAGERMQWVLSSSHVLPDAFRFAFIADRRKFPLSAFVGTYVVSRASAGQCALTADDEALLRRLAAGSLPPLDPVLGFSQVAVDEAVAELATCVLPVFKAKVEAKADSAAGFADPAVLERLRADVRALGSEIAWVEAFLRDKQAAGLLPAADLMPMLYFLAERDDSLASPQRYRAQMLFLHHQNTGLEARCEVAPVLAAAIDQWRAKHPSH